MKSSTEKQSDFRPSPASKTALRFAAKRAKPDSGQKEADNPSDELEESPAGTITKDKPEKPKSAPVLSKKPQRVRHNAEFRADQKRKLLQLSHQRKLNGVEPYSMNRILEEALDYWISEVGA